MADYPCSGIILADGAPLQSNEKGPAFVEIGSRKALDWLVDLFEALCEEVIVVATEPLAYLAWDVLIVRDESDKPDAMSGLYSGLSAAGQPRAVVASCAMPLLRPQIARLLLDTAAPRWDVVVGECGAGAIPLPGIFNKRCLKHINDHRDDDRFAVNDLIAQAHHTIVSHEAIRALDTELISFMDISTPEMLSKAEDWASKHPTQG